MQYQGLARELKGPCGAGFRLRTDAPDVTCTHGPDPSLPGIDVTNARPTADLIVVASDKPDRFAQIAPSLVRRAGQVDGVFSQSAAESGGDRHVRYMMNPDCTLNVAHGVLPRCAAHRPAATSP